MLTNFKPKYFKSAKYRKYVASFPCMRCGSFASVPHHLPRPDGARRRSGDDWCVPLCYVCHILHYHAKPVEEKKDLAKMYEKATQLFEDWNNQERGKYNGT